MTERRHRIKRPLRRRELGTTGAVVAAALPWAIYSVTSAWFLSILPWFMTPHHEYTEVHQGFTILTFVLLTLTGAAIGLVLKLAKVSDSKRFYVAASTLVLAVACIINLLANNRVGLGTWFGIVDVPHLAVAAGVAVLCAASISGKGRLEAHLRFAINPWTVSTALLGQPWVVSHLMYGSSTTAKAGVSVIFIAGLFIVSFAACRLLDRGASTGPRGHGRRPAGQSGTSSAGIGLVVANIAVIIVIDLFACQTTIERPPAATRHAPASRPNVVLITMDTVRADHLSLYGYDRKTTPNIEKFAEEATVYKRAYSAGNMTLASHASIFTGLYARTHGAHSSEEDHMDHRLSDGFATIAEQLGEKGYRTMAVAANTGYLGEGFGLSQGFDHYDQRGPVHPLKLHSKYHLREGLARVLARALSVSDNILWYRRAGAINDSAFELLDESRTAPGPFFLFVNYMDAHRPYLPPAPYSGRFPGLDPGFDWDGYEGLKTAVLSKSRGLTDAERDHLVSQYDGGIAYIDHNVGQLVEKLKDLGLYDDTLIILTSDHGEAFGEKQMMEHGVSLYENQTHLPLLIKWPRRKPLSTDAVDYPVSLVDLVPTILDVAGYAPAGPLHGRSLYTENAATGRTVMSEAFPRKELIGSSADFDRTLRSAVAYPHKYITSSNGTDELYDLARDPAEESDISKDSTKVTDRLDRYVVKWLATTRVAEGTAAKINKEAKDRLKALGYVQ